LCMYVIVCIVYGFLTWNKLLLYLLTYLHALWYNYKYIYGQGYKIIQTKTLSNKLYGVHGLGVK